ncbi:MAG TPA: LURP-one-related family protein [Trebonia sp.]
MRYLVRQRIFSLKASFWITDEDGTEVFHVDGHALQFRRTFELKDRAGAVLVTIRQQVFRLRGTMDIERDGAVIATVRRANFSPFKHRYEVTLADGTLLEATGSFRDLDWELAGAGRVVGRISRQWFKVRDTYGVEVEPGEDPAFVIAVAVCVDRLREQERRAATATS